MTTPLDRWLAPRLAARDADTTRRINDAPVTVAWYRDGTQLMNLTVRVLPSAYEVGNPIQGDNSRRNVSKVTILAAEDAMLKAGDRLVATDSGVRYLLTYVNPAQSYQTEASAEVETR